MNTFFWVMNLFLIIAIPIGFFVIAYFVIKKAVKNGIVEAYKEINANPKE